MLCRKCDSIATITIRKVYTFCDNCFITSVIHKFRACIGKNTKLRNNEKVLICLSGGLSSTVLLDLIMHGIALNTHKKLRITPIFIHLNGINSKADVLTETILELCNSYNVDLRVININEYNNEANCENEIFQIQQHLNKLSSTTKSDFLAKFKQNMFYKVAKELGCNIIFTAETNTKLSEKLLCNIVMGRGSQIENDTGFCDDCDSDIKIYRPMREITKEELFYYSKIKQLCPDYTNTNVEACSLQSVISGFISDLQENTPATISTICKTADKIGTEDENFDSTFCKICKSSIGSMPTKLTAAEATAFSKMVSSGQINSINVENNLANISVFPHIYKSLCYSCSKNYCEV